MQVLKRLMHRKQRRVIGLMSGTSLDGIDVALAVLEGSGKHMHIYLEQFLHVPYPESLVEELLTQSVEEGSSVRAISQLNVLLGHLYAQAVFQVMETTGYTPETIDLIGSHGQTLHHVPEVEERYGAWVHSTFQIGSPSIIAGLTGIPTIGNFRLADVAQGGQGAPLVPYFDYVYFSVEGEVRGLLNIGGIANLTVLPASGRIEEVMAFDTGPGNMIIDALMRKYFGTGYDKNGEVAAQGKVSEPLVEHMLAHPFFYQSPPKTTGREVFGDAFIEELESMGKSIGLTPADLVATATALTARSIWEAYRRFVADQYPLDVLIVSGGGRYNPVLMQHLAHYFRHIPVHPVDHFGVSAEAKEALCFAVLAHEWVNGVPTSLPQVTGASQPAILGELSLPPRPR